MEVKGSNGRGGKVPRGRTFGGFPSFRQLGNVSAGTVAILPKYGRWRKWVSKTRKFAGFSREKACFLKMLGFLLPFLSPFLTYLMLVKPILPNPQNQRFCVLQASSSGCLRGGGTSIFTHPSPLFPPFLFVAKSDERKGNGCDSWFKK
ncbi:hypothetical protein Pyn_23267 [Prunus yedoensis var. nudiflora]|uniref:Uncharacterized protein n=1 Tax=Prunus yedoensis var. nudiflora TaxID=2094558 RepID=A0A314YZW0_PRUYE|nr:hypothetical protein Pyn_23267 [Prunus yedoensis var. nudiflora]